MVRARESLEVAVEAVELGEHGVEAVPQPPMLIQQAAEARRRGAEVRHRENAARP